jgi:hypothetical protein
MPDGPPVPQSQKTHLIAAPQRRQMPGANELCAKQRRLLSVRFQHAEGLL